jgi:hypothetical protein
MADSRVHQISIKAGVAKRYFLREGSKTRTATFWKVWKRKSWWARHKEATRSCSGESHDDSWMPAKVNIWKLWLNEKTYFIHLQTSLGLWWFEWNSEEWKRPGRKGWIHQSSICPWRRKSSVGLKDFMHIEKLIDDSSGKINNQVTKLPQTNKQTDS